MFTAIHPKLPMRNKELTKRYYVNQLGFRSIGNDDFELYLMLVRDQTEIHFFKFEELDPAQNYGQVYIRVSGIGLLYRDLQERGVSIHPNGQLALKPWGQLEFSLLDPDNNLLTFGESVGL